MAGYGAEDTTRGRAVKGRAESGGHDTSSRQVTKILLAVHNDVKLLAVCSMAFYDEESSVQVTCQIFKIFTTLRVRN